jgi:hypothetical protein
MSYRKKDVVNNAQTALDEAVAALAAATKQEKEEEKKHADAEAEFITVVISDTGHMSKCHVPTAAVVQCGLFRILLGDTVSVSNVSDKIACAEGFEDERGSGCRPPAAWNWYLGADQHVPDKPDKGPKIWKY